MSKKGSNPYAELPWQRWELDSFDEPSAPHAKEQTVDMDAIMTEVAELKQLAQQQGHAEGYATGFDAGQADGWKQGQSEGYEAAYQKALAQGHTEGYEAGSLKAATQCEQLALLLQNSATAIDLLHEEMGQALIHLAVQIAEHVLGTELKAHPDYLNDLLDQTLKAADQSAQALTITIHPTDADLVKQHLHEELAHHPQWRIKTDEQVSPGGVYLSSALGQIDATLQARWRRAIARLGPDAVASSGLLHSKSPDHD